ncbi:TlpA disulfide reductase family protein [Carboxylicivirga sp. M1479]|uniref:TlpA family protein disulfide reductase n=1 Tax=Carboxylicivirga sp. M1479 TaxID=2594476 RepID=UPI001178753E|nr:TlpA disulfide reductase family protein [Carboxylicivirga sp. M1479]TRX71433.1 TlpA family protein disulfide reductase [Carboxylicivirga sp. M1479]
MNYLKGIALMVLAVLSACTPTPDKCIIKGHVEAKEGKVLVYPYQEVQSQEEAEKLMYKADIIDGQFTIELDSVIACRTLYVQAENRVQPCEFISEPGYIKLIEKEGEWTVQETPLNQEFKELQTALNQKAYDALRYKKELSNEEKSIKKQYNTILWELLAKNPRSIPLSYLFQQQYWGADLAMLNKIIDGFSDEIHDTYYLNYLINRRDNEARSAIGNRAPQFSIQSLHNKEVSLATLKGKYVLIDFWASWCGPCRKEIPNLKNIYKAFHNQELQIISISTDGDKEAWLKAVEEENMPWVQVHDTKKISGSYNVTGIPHIVLISPEGIILDKNMHGDGIWEALEKEGFIKE